MVNITNGMSGAWSDEFVVNTGNMIRISLKYRLITHDYESDQCGQVLVAIDGKLVQVNAGDYIEHLESISLRHFYDKARFIELGFSFWSGNLYDFFCHMARMTAEITPRQTSPCRSRMPVRGNRGRGNAVE